MLFQLTQGPNGFSGGGSVTAGSAVNIGTYAMNEVALRVARNGYTKTLTASTFLRGQPVILGTLTSTSTPPPVGGIWPNGFDVVLPGSQGATPVNNLVLGLVYDFPDTTLARNGGWNPEDTGLVQCYGLNTKAVGSVGTNSIAPGVILTPDSGGTGIGAQLVTAVGPVTAASTSTAAHTELTGIGGLFILAGSIASSSASGTVACSVFIRCM